MALNNKLIREIFPPTKFAFYGDYVNRYKRKLLKR